MKIKQRCALFKNLLTIVVFIFVILFSFSDSNAQINEDKELLFKNENVQRSERSTEVLMHKKNNTYEVESLEITMKNWPFRKSFQSYGGYNGVVVSFLKTPLGYFDAEAMAGVVRCWDEMMDNGEISGGCEEMDEGDVNLIIPFFPNGKYADIYSAEGKKIFTIDLSSKATCNENSKCDRPLEDGINCPSDCKASQPVIDDSVKQKFSGQTGNITVQNKEEIKVSWWNTWGKLALAAAILVIIAAGVIMAKMGGRRSY